MNSPHSQFVFALLALYVLATHLLLNTPRASAARIRRGRRERNRNDIKDYINDVFEQALRVTVSRADECAASGVVDDSHTF
jgi:hypothetical protein